MDYGRRLAFEHLEVIGKGLASGAMDAAGAVARAVDSPSAARKAGKLIPMRPTPAPTPPSVGAPANRIAKPSSFGFNTSTPQDALPLPPASQTLSGGIPRQQVGKSSPARTRRRAQERKLGLVATRREKRAPQLVAGKAGRELRALEQAKTTPRVPVTATPPAAAVNHATTPASAARRLTARHLKTGGVVAGSVAAGAGVLGGTAYAHHKVMNRRSARNPGIPEANGMLLVGKGLKSLAARR